MNSWLPPVIIFLFGSLLIPFLKGRCRQALLVAIPLLAFINIINMPEGIGYSFDFLGYELILARVDKLSKIFAYIFVIMAFSGAIFALHLKEAGEHAAAFLYVASSLGVVFAGDYITLFVFWEVMAIGSTYLIWAGRTERSYAAGLRYLLVHVLGGVILLIGILLHVNDTGSIAFGYVGLKGLASYFILTGFAVNAAIPPLSAWLSDSYPEASVTGTVFLSAFTTKTAVYVLARSFPGTEILIWAGAIMTLYGIVYAILENDMRRVLAYSIINQVGFMIAGIGIGTELAINGAASHAFAHILYKALLMMSASAVLYMTGKSKCTELGGLYKSMPITMWLCLVGAASISAFPLTGGFVSKSMIISAAGKEHLTAIWLMLTLASAGVFLHAGIKFPWFVFFARDSGLRPKDPPKNMIAGMGVLAFLCIFIGVFPSVLYSILPYPVHYIPYTGSHVVGQMQILLFSALAFFMLLKFLKRTNTITLDTDWLYRKGADAFMWVINKPVAKFGASFNRLVFEVMPSSLSRASKNPLAVLKIASDTVLLQFAVPEKREGIRQRIKREKEIYPGDIIRHWPIGIVVLWVILFLLAYMLIYYL